MTIRADRRIPRYADTPPRRYARRYGRARYRTGSAPSSTGAPPARAHVCGYARKFRLRRQPECADTRTHTDTVGSTRTPRHQDRATEFTPHTRRLGRADTDQRTTPPDLSVRTSPTHAANAAVSRTCRNAYVRCAGSYGSVRRAGRRYRRAHAATPRTDHGPSRIRHAHRHAAPVPDAVGRWSRTDTINGVRAIRAGARAPRAARECGRRNDARDVTRLFADIAR